MENADLSDIVYFIAVFGGPVLLGLVLVYAVMTRRRGRLRTPGELREGRPRPDPTDTPKPRP